MLQDFYVLEHTKEKKSFMDDGVSESDAKHGDPEKFMQTYIQLPEFYTQTQNIKRFFKKIDLPADTK